MNKSLKSKGFLRGVDRPPFSCYTTSINNKERVLIMTKRVSKKMREEFIASFHVSSDLQNILLEASSNVNLCSIRIHKYLTNTGLIGKVKTARFLESIQLTEKSTISQLDQNKINQITSFVSQK